MKSGDNYIRVKNEEYLLVQLDKASVFPMDKLDLVRRHKTSLITAGFEQVALKKLILTEEDLLE